MSFDKPPIKLPLSQAAQRYYTDGVVEDYGELLPVPAIIAAIRMQYGFEPDREYVEKMIPKMRKRRLATYRPATCHLP